MSVVYASLGSNVFADDFEATQNGQEGVSEAVCELSPFTPFDLSYYPLLISNRHPITAH